MTEREALKLALEALEMNPLDTPTDVYDTKYQATITAIKEALAQPEQEPVEVFLTDEHQMGFKVGVQSFILDYWPDLQSEVEFMKTQLLTAFARAKAPQRKPLTDEEIEAMWPLRPTDEIVAFARAIEAAHGINGEA